MNICGVVSADNRCSYTVITFGTTCACIIIATVIIRVHKSYVYRCRSSGFFVNTVKAKINHKAIQKPWKSI